MLSKKTLPVTINYLFERYEKDTDKILKLIHAEAIILYTDKFGTLIYSEKEKTSKRKERKKESYI